MTENTGSEPTADRFRSVRAGRIRRTAPVVGFAARAAGGRVVAELRSRNGDPGAVDRFHRDTAERYTELLGHSKGVLMKAGQLLSTFDVASDESALTPYQRAMTRLQADAPPMDPATARDIVERDLGALLDDLFESFDEQPIAAASIGQVHEAHLYDGRRVAVKVQYPGVAQAIRDDLANTELLATFMKLGMSMSPWAMRTDQRGAAAEVAERVAEEVDYRHEARAIGRFADLYRGHPFIRVPDVIETHSGARVLTMTYLDGIGWDRAREADQELRNRWGEAISYFAFGAYRHGNLFNADPHPGNYRFAEDGSVGFVDFGCTKMFPEHVRQAVVTLVDITAGGDRQQLWEQLIRTGFATVDTGLTPDEAFDWWSTMVITLVDPQPHVFVPEDSTTLLNSFTNGDAIGTATRKMTIPSDCIMLGRINLGINAVLTGLGCRLYAKEMLDALDKGIAAPTEFAGRHVAWARQRGLPFGLDPR